MKSSNVQVVLVLGQCQTTGSSISARLLKINFCVHLTGRKSSSQALLRRERDTLKAACCSIPA